MLKTILIWILAFIITAATAIYQRITGPTYPLSGKSAIGQTDINYKFLRSENVGTDLIIKVESDNSQLNSITYWKRFKTNDEFTAAKMEYNDGVYQTKLPSQPAAGKLEYFVIVMQESSEIQLPPKQHVVARYKGAVPTVVLIFHVIAMFGAMLLSTRTGLEFFREDPKLNKLTLWTIGFLFVGGLILGPIVQKYAFDAYWTGWPFGHDLTDNKTLVAFIGWLAAYFMYKRSSNPQRWALGAAIVLMVIYLIPHSVLGSELDYNKLDKQKNNTPVSQQDLKNTD